MTELEATSFPKDEEKDINLLLARVKKNPSGFRDRILSKLQEFSGNFEELKRDPGTRNLDFASLCIFFAQIYELYPTELREYLSSMMEVVDTMAHQLHPANRFKIVQCIIVIQKKGFIDFLKSIPFYTKLFDIKDKKLRKMLSAHIVNFIKSYSKKKKLSKIEGTFARQLSDLFKTSSIDIIRVWIKILMRLYIKRIWISAKLVNLIAEQIYSPNAKTSFLVAKFLMATTEESPITEDSDDEGETLAELTQKFAKKYKKSKNKIEKMEKQIANARKKEARREKLLSVARVYPIDMIYSPNRFVQTLIQKLTSDKSGKFAWKFEVMCLIGRLICRHRLIFPSYFNMLLRYVRPEVSGLPKLLTFAAEAVHENSPIEDLENFCKKVIETLVMEGMGDDKISLGINVLRLILLRNQHAMGADDINYVCGFKVKRKKNISSAARAFLNIAREVCPDMLNKEFLGFEIKKAQKTEQRLVDTGDFKNRIDGAHLLGEDTDIPVECQRVLGDEDFKKIKMLKRKQVLENMRSEAERQIATDYDKRNLEELREKFIAQKYKGEAEDEDEDDEEGEDDGEDEEGMEIDEEELDKDYDEIEYEDSDEDGQNDDDEEDQEDEDDEEEGNSKNEMEIEEEEEIDEVDMEAEEDEDEDESEEELEKMKTGFLSEDLVTQFKSKQRKKVEKSAEHFEKLIAKKYATKKKNKKGSKTNSEKLKNKPELMIMDKIKRKQRDLKAVTRKISKKDKNFKGHYSKLSQKFGKRK